jgi:hypothetical protein
LITDLDFLWRLYFVFCTIGRRRHLEGLGVPPREYFSPEWGNYYVRPVNPDGIRDPFFQCLY